jgi:hippurate hydrolase
MLCLVLGAAAPALIAQAQAKGTQVPVNHSPLFAPLPEPTIRTGVEAMTLAVMNVMTPPGEAAPSNEGTAP